MRENDVADRAFFYFLSQLLYGGYFQHPKENPKCILKLKDLASDFLKQSPNCQSIR